MITGKMPSHYVLVMGNDWEGLYLNDELLTQDRSIQLSVVMKHLIKTGNTVTSFATKSCNNDWLEAVGGLPQNLNEVVWK